MAALAVRPKLAIGEILVITDFSATSTAAFRHAIDIARHYGSKICLVHALAAVRPRQPLERDEFREAVAKEKLRLAAATCSDLECSQSVLKGRALEVAERILSFEDVDLVVVGIHGAKGFRRITTGSAAEHFFRHVRCPVLAVGPSVGDAQRHWEPRRILLATDLQSDEAAATRCAALLTLEHDAHLALLHVAPPPTRPFPDDVAATAFPYFESRLQALLAYKYRLQPRAELWVEFGEDPAREIVRVARERNINLIIISVHREEPWGFDFVHTAYGIVAEAPCPVLITQRKF